MKKSKIIVPALGILAFSTAAAVTGTVAWFTANRQGHIENSAITAYNPEAGLSIVLSENTSGVDITSNPGAAAHGYLRDASVDMANDVVYGSKLGADGELDSTTPYKVISDANYVGGQLSDGTTNFYYANKYTATFSLTTTTSNDSYGLIYDNSLSSHTGTDAIKAALRIGFFVSNSTYFVINPFRASVDTTSINFVNSTTTATGTYSGHAIYSGDTSASSIGAEAAAATVSANIGYLGTLTKTGSISATVYTWFEGLDPDCVNANAVTVAGLTSDLYFRLVKIS